MNGGYLAVTTRGTVTGAQTATAFVQKIKIIKNKIKFRNHAVNYDRL